ncbi:helix-turn-helix domain-containing protein [Actinomadura sp. ATCC 31491]|uniref:Helix-turn-helix domain-containing protein n=1 Tax=Actinomadura luzonensis TaxID=2805427 RepID=A0ABT0G2L3_9ACTN|nr:helix-turn-helix transcriptional regulator [Actinomadura luzonensis]MCK2218815.1 helix-turn-helix domain-containing protein [Actinomadura luzonensis]
MLATITVATPVAIPVAIPGAEPVPTGAEPALGTLLRAWRERSLLTQEELAERSGLASRTIRRLESGELRRPRSTSVRLLARALELEEAELAVLAEAAARRPVALTVTLLYVVDSEEVSGCASAACASARTR